METNIENIARGWAIASQNFAATYHSAAEMYFGWFVRETDGRKRRSHRRKAIIAQRQSADWHRRAVEWRAMMGA